MPHARAGNEKCSLLFLAQVQLGDLRLSEDQISIEEQNDQFAQRRIDLNRRMLKLPVTARRENWGYYYRRLCELNESPTP